MLSPGVATSGVAAVIAATDGCKLVELDARNGAGAAVLVAPSGIALQISRSAAELIRACRERQPLEAIAKRFGVPVERLDDAFQQLSTRIRSRVAEQQRRPITGFLARRRFLSSATVTRIVEPLRFLCTLRVAVPSVAAALAVLVVLYAPIARTPLTSAAWWAGFAIGLVLLFVHELGHAAACRRHDAHVGEIGVALYLIYPAFYCDVTHAWALPRRARIAIDLGGVYFQLLATAGLACIWYATGSAVLAAAVRISAGAIVLNLLPLGRLDGYWLLADTLGIVDLGSQWRTLTRAVRAKLRGRPAALPWPRWISVLIAVYSLATAVFIASILHSLLPFVWREACAAPARIGALPSEIASGAWTAALAALGRLVSSVVVGWTAFALLRGLVRAVTRADSRQP